MKILIVEDSADIRDLLLQLLESEGHQVFFAEDGQAGIEEAKTSQPDLILMDMSLPILSGWDAVRQLRQTPEFKLTPILALTAHASESDQHKALAIGCTAYISKPFDLDNLLNSIEQYITSDNV